MIIYENKRAEKTEEERVSEILSRSAEWGDEMCQWLIDKNYNPKDDARVSGILQSFETFGVETCQNLLRQSIGIGMTSEMVQLSLGKPNNIDNREVREKWEKYRWIYGIPRQGAAYFGFKNGKVTKIKN